ncbi:serine/threonine-protein kinase [Pseudofrankia inefficax]|uniref:Serine/threonine protein kinase n=1 Tax=Pseudofrankia inefficax (strain DSM 45817 / CECT 9037 / DDB 130130 / EuI1c) TaxID=298654 RepID=E3IXW4_PSEI1|nr:serine/threonine-protein kinase [Pseudofrankia inefficax]ADP81419.1 serine/threonine protein kinase [Pseudofrankia inefficax]
MNGSSTEQVSPTGPGLSLQAHDPTTVGQYSVLRRLGAGGMGTVYLGRGPADSLVAIKVIRPDLALDQEFRRRFRREIEAARSVAPFCTAEVLDADPDAAAPYLVTEFIEGTRLDEAVEAAPLSPSTLTGLAIGVATALAAIHRAGLVHRDLKPSNVILSLSGPRVIDFGIAQVLDGGIAKPTAWGFGSTGWMAPEQINGQAIGPAADVFAWGLLVAYAASGCHPFGSDTDLGLARRIANAEPVLIGLPADLAEIVRAALAKDPANRPSARDLLLRLVEREPGGGAEPALRLLAPTRAQPRSGATPQSRRRLVAGLAALTLALVALTGIWWAVGRPGGGQPDPAAMATAPPVGASSTPSSATPSSSTPSAAQRPSASPTPRGFADGSLRFSVDGVECGVTGLGVGLLTGQSDGHFCLVTMTVRNTGAAPRQLDNGDQYAFDSLGERHTADYTARFYLPGGIIWATVNPGGSVHGTMAFDVPDGARLTRLELHTTTGTSGVSIPV